MFRTALRTTRPRAVVPALRQNALTTTAPGRRLASTTPAKTKKGTWRGFAVRLALLGGAVYWYNTDPAFAEEIQPQNVTAPAQFSDDDLPTIEAVVEQKRREAEARLAKARPQETIPAPDADSASPPSRPDSESPPPPPQDGEGVTVGGPSELEAEADQQGAFNPETGEINWDCPCLGGMAHGVCGEQFKLAFSCFVYSKEEPKGIDCIDKFQVMQDCFRAHPEVYGEELGDQDDEYDGDEAPAEGAPATREASATANGSEGAVSSQIPAPAHDATAANATQPKPEEREQAKAKAEESKASAQAADPTRDATAANIKTRSTSHDEDVFPGRK